jgi:hypothetical protein
MSQVSSNIEPMDSDYRKATAGTSHSLDGFGPYRADLLRLRFGRTKIYSGSWCARASGYVCRHYPHSASPSLPVHVLFIF